MFRIHRSERADALADALVRILSEPLDDPFTAEIIAVPTKGVERWLTHRIATAVGTSPGRADGVCAHVDFPFPGRLVGDALATATGVDRKNDPWRPERLTWPLLEVIDANLSEPWLDVLADHLGTAPSNDNDNDNGDDETAVDPTRRRRRYATAHHLAALYDSYATYRPDMVLGWHHDRDDDLPTDARWQAELWRHLRAHLGVESPAERIDAACARLRAGLVTLDLPERISLFGLTRLPATYLEVLRALATNREVHLFALHPSARLWERVGGLAPPALPVPRRDDPTADAAHHPLLRTWANDTREMQLILAAAADAPDVHHPVGTERPNTLLGHLQDAIRADSPPPGPAADGEDDPRIRIAADDRSLQIHACHGRARQVEVVRDAICHALADDRSLEPRDIIVLCPDIDEFAPLLHATFGGDDATAAEGARGIPAIPYRLADRSLRQTNPLFAGVDALLELIDGRVSAPDVLAFLGREPVRQRFFLDDDALGTIRGWIDDANIRWGLDTDHRAGYDLGAVEANTWSAGLDRIMLGIAMTHDGDPLVGGRTPIDDVESGDVDLAGRLAEAIDRIRYAAAQARTPATVAAWTERLADAADALMAPGPTEMWQRAALDELLREVVAEATGPRGPSTSELSLTEVRTLLARRLEGVPTRADFRTGAVTMCTLHPMRAVPHRMVCVLGLDDGTFPRRGGTDGDDLLARLPQIGDRDARWEDRQLLLDALLSATDTFVATTTGRDPHTNEECPPAVPLAELIDVCDRMALAGDGRPVRTAIVVDHPLQPFDPIEFDADERPGRRPWSFDRIHLAGAVALGRPTTTPARLADITLDPITPPAGALPLTELLRLLQHPAREFLRQRLGVSTWDGDRAPADHLPLQLDNLEQWAVGSRILAALLDGVPDDAAVAAEAARGSVPPEAMGTATLERAAGRARAVYQEATERGVAEAVGRDARSVGVDVRLGGVAEASGVTSLVGTVTGVHNGFTGSVSFSSVSARDRLDAWIRLLALTAQEPDRPWQAVHVGRYGGRGTTWTVGPIGDDPADRAEVARTRLEELAELWAIGMRVPLPMPPKTGEAWARASRRGRSAYHPARKAWETANPDYDVPNEDVDANHVQVFGAVIGLRDLLAITATDAETGPGWADDRSRFVRLARRLWDPLLDVEAGR